MYYGCGGGIAWFANGNRGGGPIFPASAERHQSLAEQPARARLARMVSHATPVANLVPPLHLGTTTAHPRLIRPPTVKDFTGGLRVIGLCLRWPEHGQRSSSPPGHRIDALLIDKSRGTEMKIPRGNDETSRRDWDGTAHPAGRGSRLAVGTFGAQPSRSDNDLAARVLPTHVCIPIMSSALISRPVCSAICRPI